MERKLEHITVYVKDMQTQETVESKMFPWENEKYHAYIEAAKTNGYTIQIRYSYY